ncbi:MAG TPA: OmpH family outer membrane protein [Panacibacter sp.]|nr:OmpH family outer membrane protein [Panacibacter sp.]
MKKVFLSVFTIAAVLFSAQSVKAQQFKVGVFDLDLMVQAMPGYGYVDSLVNIYNTDSLGAEYEIYTTEYKRLDSTYKADSVKVAAGTKSATILAYTDGERRKMMTNLVYWQQIAQKKSEDRRGLLAQPLYEKVAAAYKKVLDARKYTLVLKPQTYELGFAIDNIFISVAKELKLTDLPQQLIYLGDDPDAVKAPPVKAPPATGTKPKTN